VRRPYLGIKFHSPFASPFSPRGHLGSSGGVNGGGVSVLEVAPGSPAETAGLQAGDVIVEFDKRPVVKNRDIVERLGFEYGRPIAVKVRRSGVEMNLTVVSSKPKGGDR